MQVLNTVFTLTRVLRSVHTSFGVALVYVINVVYVGMQMSKPHGSHASNSAKLSRDRAARRA